MADSPAATFVAERFAHALVRGAWAEAAALSVLQPPPGTTVDEMLRALWTQLTAQLGAVGRVQVGEVGADGGVRHIDLDAAFTRSDVTLRVVLNDAGQVSGFWIRPPRPRAWSPPPYADLTRFEEHAVVVGGEPPLPGTLTLPNERPAAGAPAVILVHGSGPNDRDERLGPNRPFKDLAWGLASRGVAVLRYDKRTYAAPESLRGRAVTVEAETIVDALAALAVARATPGVDARRVVVVGHSLGGALAPEIAHRDGRVGGVVLLAPGGARPSADVLEAQLAHLAASDPGVRAQLDAARPLLAAIRDRTLPPAGDALGVPAGYWYDLDDRRPLDAARTLDVPLLALFGGRDYQVPDADAARWASALAGRPDATVERHPMLDHLFRAGEGVATPADYQGRGAPVAPAVVERLADWILALPPRD